MPPTVAESILYDAYIKHNNILIIEGTNRIWLNFVRIPLSMFLFGFLSPLLTIINNKELPSLRRILFTYILPIYPLTLCIDGLISTLRTYDEVDIKNMINNITIKNKSHINQYNISNKLSHYKVSTIDKIQQYQWTYGIVKHNDWKFWMPSVTYVLGKKL